MKDTVYTTAYIKSLVSPIALKHGVEKMYLFGSYAKGTADTSSDIDIYIEAPAIKGMFALGGLYADLEEALGKSLDLITDTALVRNKDKEFVENLIKERVLIYDR